jgi:hypothetical protein
LILSRILFSFFLFAFLCVQSLFAVSGKHKKRHYLTPLSAFQIFTSLSFSLILFLRSGVQM